MEHSTSFIEFMVTNLHEFAVCVEFVDVQQDEGDARADEERDGKDSECRSILRFCHHTLDVSRDGLNGWKRSKTSV